MRATIALGLFLLAGCSAGGRPWIVVNNISVEQAEEDTIARRPPPPAPVVRLRR